MKIRQSTANDIQQMKALWQISFNDPLEYVSFFFQNRFRPQNACVITDKCQIIGMFHLLPCKIVPEIMANYWYGVAIHPEYRGKGIFTKFAKVILDDNRKKGFYNLCKPAAGLYQVYKNIGFQYEYCCNLFTHNDNENANKTNLVFNKITEKDYIEENQNFGDVLWEPSATEYALAENIFSGGKNILFFYRDKKYFATALEIERKHFLLTNTNITKNIFDTCYTDIINYLNCNKITLREYGVGNTPYVLTDYPGVTHKSRAYFTLE